MRRFALAGLLIAALAQVASANGRAAATSTIHFQEGAEQNIVAGMTFGVLFSHDGGTTWHWMCEDAVGYGGMWDPDYSYEPNGTLFATTFDGLRSMTDGCTFTSTAYGNLFVSTDEGKGSAFLFGASDPHDAKIYRSGDQGMTFMSTTPAGAMNGDWYTSLKFAPSDPTTLYTSSYRIVGSTKVLLLYKSIDGGATFTTMGQTGLPTTTSSSSTIEVVGVDPTNPSIVYIRMSYANGTASDTIYKSTNAGQSWTAIRTKAETPISFLVRSNGELVIGTRALGAEVSTTGGSSWTPLTNPPQINCLAENAAHEVWACTQNYDTMNGSGAVVPGDGYGIMKTTDLASWTPVLKFQNIAGPVDCAAGTVQHDTCVVQRWCGLRSQLGITATGGVDCAFLDAGGSGGGGGDGGVHVHPPGKGCCDTGPGDAPPLAMGLVVGLGLLRRRRKTA